MTVGSSSGRWRCGPKRPTIWASISAETALNLKSPRHEAISHVWGMADLLASAEGMAGPDDARGKPFRGGQEVGPSAEGQKPRSLVGCTRIGSEYLSEKL